MAFKLYLKDRKGFMASDYGMEQGRHLKWREQHGGKHRTCMWTGRNHLVLHVDWLCGKE